MSQYTEDTLVQETTADYLEQELGWRSVYAYKKEDFGPDSLLGRTSERDVVLEPILRAKLAELNPGLPDDAYGQAVHELVAINASQGLIATNREKHELLRDGVPVTFRDADGKLQQDRLRVLDFDEPLNNDFLCVRELVVKGELYNRRADIVGFVNGLPLLFIECKNIHRDLKSAHSGNYSAYRDNIPHLFHHNAIVMVANGEQAKIGSLTSQWSHFHDWKRLEEDDPGVVDMETLLKGVCNRRHFLDLVENFIFFDESSGEPRKILARNHQFLGVNRAIESVKNRHERQGKLGVFWHTQGAGKSYSMVMFTRKIHRKLGGNFTFLVVTDRDDLDTQIYKTFAGCGVVNHDQDPCRASSGSHLSELLTQHKAYVFTLIQKFNHAVDPDAASPRDDVIVISDEAHRTNYGTFALNMRDALPNAGYIGFTGTPLFSDDEITRRVFGDYVSTYDFQRAVEDNATVPLYYDARGDDLQITVGDLNRRIADKLEELTDNGDLDINEQERLEKELKRDYHIFTADKRLRQVARDFVQHYSKGWETGKAMLVCLDKVTCVRMHELILEYWHERILELQKQGQKSKDEQQEIYLQRQIRWMKETLIAVVVSEEQGEVEAFRKRDLDITPHRKLIKEGVDLPPAMRGQARFQGKQRMKLDDAFKESEHPFRVAIVCAMWLTGFDVPSLSTLYLDKPMKAHTLMQAIARANRVNEGKNNGLVVDYCGILKHLREALATFAGTHTGPQGEDRQLDPTRPREDLLEDLAEAILLARNFLDDRDAPVSSIQDASGFGRIAAITACKDAVNENDESRKRFEVMCREVFKKFKAAHSMDGIEKHRADRDAIDIVYKRLRKDREKADISEVLGSLHGIVDEAIETRQNEARQRSKPYDISKIDFERLKEEFSRSRTQRTSVQNLRHAVEQRVRRLLHQNPLRTDLQQRYEQIVTDYNREKDRVTIEETFEALLALVETLDDETHRAMREGLNEESLAVYDLLRKPDLAKSDMDRIKRIAVELLQTLKAEKLRVDQWREKEATRDAVKSAIYDFLYSDATGLPVQAYEEEEVTACTEMVYRHVYRAYPTVPSPIYGELGVGV